MDVVSADAPEAVSLATLTLDARGLVAYPAGGRYALGADALDEDAVHAVRRATRRPPDAPLSVAVPDLESARHVATVTPTARRLAHLFPGPLVLVLPLAPTAPENLAGGGGGTVAVRVPPEDFARRLAQHFGPVVATRAAPPGAPAPRRVADVAADGVAVAVDDGAFADAPSATVVDATGAEAKVLKAGALPAEALAASERNG